MLNPFVVLSGLASTSVALPLLFQGFGSVSPTNVTSEPSMLATTT